jgi:hypothetical protein
MNARGARCGDRNGLVNWTFSLAYHQNWIDGYVDQPMNVTGDIAELEQEQQKLILERTFTAILRLSSWRPSSANNGKLAKVVGSAKKQLEWLRDDDEHQTYLREFMTKHRILCAFIVSRAEDITLQESAWIAEACRELRTLTQKLRRNAVTKAEDYQRLYDIFTANREGLSGWLNLATTGKFLAFLRLLTSSESILDVGRALFNTFTGSLKGMANSMRREADFWEHEGNKIDNWQDTLQRYTSTINSIPPVDTDVSHTHSIEVGQIIRLTLTRN